MIHPMLLLNLVFAVSFQPPPIGSTVYFLNDVFLISAEDGNQPLRCNRSSIGAGEQFLIVDAGDSTIALLGNNGLYVTGTNPMHCNSNVLDSNSRFHWVVLGNNRVALQNLKGQYISAAPEKGAVQCTETAISTAETFTWGTVSAGGTTDDASAIKVETADLKLFPNPASGNVNIKFELHAAGEVLIEFYNYRGALVKSFLGGLQEGGTRINVSIGDLPAGMYVVRLSSKGIIDTKKLIVQ